MLSAASPEQRDQAVIVQSEVIELINRLIVEGIDRRVIMAGVGIAAADLVTCTFGAAAVEQWFDAQAAMARAARGG